ncbi:hypothetical protein Cgig2_011738 [Carnegiea gigantea]|uniref:Uncharacterized protein n=1 Tax=Carnegiea gigantea TaxID=171969 RepID=A0A9Q1KI30_9CARY|nr:hypothetical protein Cgig2_011738 [Carnegiea gigantea]
MADKGQIDRFLKRGPCFLRKERELAGARAPRRRTLHGYNDHYRQWILEGITCFAWKAQLRGAQQVLTAEQGSRVIVPTMVFGGGEGPRFTSPHNDPLVVELKVDSALIRRIPIDMGSSKLKYRSFGTPHLGFRGVVNATGMIRLPLRFGEKAKVRTLEVDFLVVDVPIAYNIILERPTLHKVKVAIAPYLLQLQFEADDRSIGTVRGDQQTARECYLVLATKKSVAGAWVFTEGYLMARGVAYWLLRDLMTAEDPVPCHKPSSLETADAESTP